MDGHVNGAFVKPMLAYVEVPVAINGVERGEIVPLNLHEHGEPDASDSVILEDGKQDEPKGSTGYVYDSRMLDHWPTIEPKESETPHPEQPARISKIHTTLRIAQCLTRMRKLHTRLLQKHEAMLVHSEDHWDKVEAIACK